MRVGVIGASGMAGSAIFREARSRVESPVAIVRDARRAVEVLGADAEVMTRDAFSLTADDLAGLDAVVDAFATAPDLASQHIDLAEHLVTLARELGDRAPRLFFVLGAGSLVAGDDGHLHVEDIAAIPGSEAFIDIPRQQKLELDYLRTVTDVSWVGLSPQDAFVPGPASTPQLADDELLLASDGTSHTTAGTYAVAVLDELQEPAHRNTRFTVGDE